MSEYQAKFADESGEFFSVVLGWDAATGPLLPSAWWKILRASADVDVALRVSGGTKPRSVLLLTTSDARPLADLTQALTSTDPPTDLRQAGSAEEFDAMTDPPLPETQLRTNHDGYHRDGQPLGCDFRLFSSWAGSPLPEGLIYQVGLHAHPFDPEQERRVRKYLAWLELEHPFTPMVREMQRIIGERLLHPVWLADEYLLFDTPERGAAWRQRLEGQFRETTGRIGFSEPPVEAGDFSAWLITGRHTARGREADSAVPVLGAAALSEKEVEWLFGQQAVADSATTPGKPEIFISYASADFAEADAIRQHLETNGRRCWIAPRDINREGLPYTEAIPKAIRQVSAVVVLLSPSANLSVHIPRELDLALENRCAIVPLRLDEIVPAGQLEYLLRTCQWLDLFSQSRSAAMLELMQRLRDIDQRRTG